MAKFCIYCGSPLEEGQACACRAGKTLHHCAYCGRQIYEDETCGCRTEAAAAAGGTGKVPMTGTAVWYKICFMPAILARLSNGVFFRRFFYLLLVILGVIEALGGLILSILQTKQIWTPLVGGVVAYIVILPISLVSVYIYTHLLFLRAKDIALLPDERYHAARIFVILFKLLGENGAVAFLQMGLIGGVAAWAGSTRGMSVLNMLGLGNLSSMLFPAGLGLIIGGCLLAAGWLALFYYFSSMVQVKLDIEENTRRIALK